LYKQGATITNWLNVVQQLTIDWTEQLRIIDSLIDWLNE